MPNNLRTTLDLPVWEWLSTLPQTINNAASAMTSAQSGNGRYIYYSLTSVFFRYDTWTNVWATLLPPTYYTPVTVSAMQCQEVLGNRGRILETLGPTQFRIPYLAGGTALEGVEMRIMYGPGSQETRKIISSSNAVTHDGGVLTAGTGAIFTDTTKKWKVNQWVGYTCRLISSTNSAPGDQRTIISNTETTLTFADVNNQQYEPWDNQGFRGSVYTGSTYEIASQIIEIDVAYNITPSIYSRFMVKTGVVWLLSSSTGSPFYTFQMYDVLTNMWYQKTMNTGMFGGALSTEIQIESASDLTGALITGTASAGTVRTITDATLSLPEDRYRNYSIRIVKGTGAGQDRRIVANKGDYFEVDSKWTVTPDATSEYEIYPDDNLIYFVGAANAATVAYHMEADMWITGPYFDYGVLGNAVVKKNGDVGLGVSTAIRATGGVTSIAVSVGGSGYIVGDVLTISTGTNAQCYVTSTDPLGAVTGVELRRCGNGYTTGVKATTGGTGTLCTIDVLTVDIVATVTTSLNNMLRTGDVVTISGATDAAWNTTYTILGVWGATTFDIVITAAANLVVAATTSTTLLVDANEVWDVNEHVGKFIMLVQGGSITPASQIRRITSNTSNTITVPTVSAFTPVSGSTRYIILNPASFGRDTKFQPKDQYPFGYASGGTTTTIVDSTKNWIRGTWVGHVVRVVAGTGLGAELTITANNDKTLVFAAAAFTPDTTTRYEIMDAYGTATSGSTTTLVDTAKNWVTNQWVNKRVRFIGGANQGVEVAITANTNNTLTFAATTAIDATTNYVIIGVPARGAGCGLKWTYGNDNDNYLWSTTGGGSYLTQRYNINNQTFDYGFIIPGFIADTFTTNTSYAYDGEDTIYIQWSNTGSIYALDIKKRVANLYSRIPGANSTGYVGNRMELIRSVDGYKFLYVPQTAGSQLFWRTLINF